MSQNIIQAISLWKGVIRYRPQRSMREIAAEVCQKHGIGIRDLLGDDKRRAIAYPRQEAMWTIRQETGFSTTQIGAFLQRDHATVLYGIRAHERRMSA